MDGILIVVVDERLDETGEKTRIDVAEEEDRRLEGVAAPCRGEEVEDGVFVGVVV